MPLDRCYECGGLLKGAHLGFEAVCNCYRGRVPKRKLEVEPKRQTFERVLESDIPKL